MDTIKNWDTVCWILSSVLTDVTKGVFELRGIIEGLGRGSCVNTTLLQDPGQILCYSLKRVTGNTGGPGSVSTTPLLWWNCELLHLINFDGDNNCLCENEYIMSKRECYLQWCWRAQLNMVREGKLLIISPVINIGGHYINLDFT